MKHAIITVCDSRYGDFLINHWLKSLQDNVDLSNIDVVVIDYGLNEEHFKKLKDKGVIVYKGVRDGFPNSIKFRDMLKFLSKRKYDQILTCDGGDIIFQTDISNIFEENKNTFRAVLEEYAPPFKEIFLKGFFSRECSKEIKSVLRKKTMVNVGFFLGPYNFFKKLCKECDEIIKKKVFGPDTVAVNYILHRDGFVNLPAKYNFIITTSKESFYIKNGVFYLKNDKKIPVVHNTGYKPLFRPISKFGYGLDRNELNKIKLFAVRGLVRIVSFKAKKYIKRRFRKE